MEAGKSLECTCDVSSGVEGSECEHSLIKELERPYSAVSKERRKGSRSGA